MIISINFSEKLWRCFNLISIYMTLYLEYILYNIYSYKRAITLGDRYIQTIMIFIYNTTDNTLFYRS